MRTLLGSGRLVLAAVISFPLAQAGIAGVVWARGRRQRGQRG
ncbi:hypothetical protein NG819_14700 [Pseudarthrobacter sp. Fe7]|nr:hypothetical protein NG819_14700 [Pseudarthrobacter sp. Fe7]